MDVILVGLGAMGSASAWQLARRGRSVLAFDRYAPPHTLGSTHGRTRIIREAYFEHPAYVPFVRRAYELWDETERISGERLFLRTRGLMIGREDGPILAGSVASARAHGIPHELLTAADVTRRFPALHPSEDMVALLEERAGILFPEAVVRAQLRIAADAGAEVISGTAVTGWEASESGVTVTTSDGARHGAERLVLAAGPWMPELLSGHRLPLTTERQTMHWFTPKYSAGFEVAACPIAVWDDPGRPAFATFPDLGDGVKIAIHHGGVETDPETMDRSTGPADERAARERLERYLPSANGQLNDSAVCIYTNTPDDHFVIGFLDGARRVLVVSPCSGHGFKFASAVGEAVACLVTDSQPPIDLSLFGPDRFGHRPTAGRN